MDFLSEVPVKQDIRAAFSRLVPDLDSVTYEGLVESLGYQILHQDYLSQGYSHGDILMLLREDNRFGFLVIGYGSCNRCDALESASDSWEELEDLRNSLDTGIRWGSAEELLAYLEDKDFEVEWYYHQDSRVLFRFLKKVMKTLLQNP